MQIQTNRQASVHRLLTTLHGLDPLKRLFWTELGYERVNQVLPRSSWTDTERTSVEEDPTLFAASGTDGEFKVIYVRLASDQLLQTLERPIVSRLLKGHPYALFAFSNRSQNRWHFVNVKYDPKQEKRRLFRRITVGPGEHLRTAAERLALLDMEAMPKDMFGVAPLAIQQKHDEAFDVEAVSRKFFQEYRQVFERVETLIQGITEADQRRLFTQKLFNRLMFIAFIQKKGWLRFDGHTDYLAALWDSHRHADSSDKNFYNDRLKLLFFAGLNTPHEVNVIDINKRGFLQTVIGDVPYLNGGLFEEDEGDRNPDLVVPDECFGAILDELFDRYNFTVTESTPLDVEVAVDPEMLGRVFEELVTDRHEGGSYYTPKPIVSFMCREALKGYLKNMLPTEAPAAIDAFVDTHTPTDLRNPEGVLEALRRVKVCDPACGSGAYLLGMLHELLDLRAALFATSKIDQLSTYQRKLEIIQQNVYGVDLKEFAVNIARLRLWLSLAVDYEGTKPEPLPNLDFKIEAGDSLTAPDPTGGLQLDMFRQTQVDDYFKLKAEYLQAHSGEKQSLKKKIEELRQEIIGWAHPKGGEAGFDWQVEFAEVFSEGGFDIIVANPPYVRQELIRDLKPILQKVFPSVYTGMADLYVYFYARALQLLREGGMLSFISSNKWFKATYGSNLRKKIAETCVIKSITDFVDLPVFESATAYPMIFVAQKGIGSNSTIAFTQVQSLASPYPDVLTVVREQGHKLPTASINGSTWNLTDEKSSQAVAQMVGSGMPLGKYVKELLFRGLTMGLNTAFVISPAQRHQIITKDANSAEYIKCYFRGRDIKRWHISYPDLYVIHVPWDFPIRSYPAIAEHLEQFKAQLAKRPDVLEGRVPWYAMSRYGADYHLYFKMAKIVVPDIASEPRFALDLSGAYLGNTAYIIPLEDLYLLGILNSRSVEEFYRQLSSQVRGGYLRFIRQYVEQIPIPNAADADRNIIADLVKKCLDSSGKNCEEWEQEINERVARLYGLTDSTGGGGSDRP